MLYPGGCQFQVLTAMARCMWNLCGTHLAMRLATMCVARFVWTHVESRWGTTHPAARHPLLPS